MYSNRYISSISLLILTVFLTLTKAGKPLKPGQCEVCVKVMEKFIDSIDEDVKKSQGAIEESFQEFCKNLKDMKEHRFCYYIGGLEESATKILPTMSKPVSSHMPPLKICEKIRDGDSQICELKYEKKIDLANVNLKKLKVKDLKKILSDWGEDRACMDCPEKSDFIKKVEELMPKYDPEAFKKRSEKQEL